MSVVVLINRDRCKGCELCTTVCPKHIVVMDCTANRKGYYPAAVSDVSLCIACGSCAKICPDSVITIGRED